MRRILWLVILALALGACSPGSQTCATGEAVEIVQLFFGRDVKGRAPVSDAEWQNFVDTEMLPSFPDGLTVIEAEGRWREPGGRTISEPTKLVIIVVPGVATVRTKIDAVTAAYKRRFDQQSVGVVVAPACAAF